MVRGAWCVAGDAWWVVAGRAYAGGVSAVKLGSPERLPRCFFDSTARRTLSRPAFSFSTRHSSPATNPGCPASDKPTCTTCAMFSGDSRSSRRVSRYWAINACTCFCRSRSNRSIRRIGSDSFSAFSVSSRVRRPSMASSTCCAITIPTLPRSSRIVSIFNATRIRNSRSASMSDTVPPDWRLWRSA